MRVDGAKIPESSTMTIVHRKRHLDTRSIFPISSLLSYVYRYVHIGVRVTHCQGSNSNLIFSVNSEVRNRLK